MIPFARYLAPAEHGSNSLETADRRAALDLEMPMDVPMVHLVANIAMGRTWIKDIEAGKRRALLWWLQCRLWQAALPLLWSSCNLRCCARPLGLRRPRPPS